MGKALNLFLNLFFSVWCGKKNCDPVKCIIFNLEATLCFQTVTQKPEEKKYYKLLVKKKVGRKVKVPYCMMIYLNICLLILYKYIYFGILGSLDWTRMQEFRWT